MTTSLFETVKNVRRQLSECQERALSPRTEAFYETQMRHFFSEQRTAPEILQLLRQTTKASTWYVRRAAVKNRTEHLMRGLLKRQDQLQRTLRSAPPDDPRWLEFKSLIHELDLWSDLHKTVASAPALAWEERKPRQSKRSALRGLPGDWCERVVKRMPSYRNAVLVSAAAGLRPSELAKGVRISIDGDLLTVLIQGSKVGSDTGQPWRKLSWSVRHPSPIIQALIAEVRAGLTDIRISSPKQFQGAVRAAGEREWPGRAEKLSPYCFRHQVASDMKGGGIANIDISAALGHTSTATKSTYGHYRIGRRSYGGVQPDRVEAARPVRLSKTSFINTTSSRSKKWNATL